jgi:serine/threonine protein kinase
MTAQMLLSLHFLELNKIIHRDLKPDNILVDYRFTEYPDIFLTDFGFATHIDEQNPGFVCGTPGYVAPEAF